MGRIVFDEIHFLALLLLSLFILQWTKGKLNKEGTTYKSLAYLKGV
jgi:hypothetical protein